MEFDRAPHRRTSCAREEGMKSVFNAVNAPLTLVIVQDVLGV
jgi:hypothetical protein